MVALSFKAAFADDVEEGRKRRTIRRTRKAKNPAPGDELQLYSGLRTKACRKLADAICTRVRVVTIDHMGIKLEGRHLWAGHAPAYQGGVDPEHYDGDFAHADGFQCFGDMADFFESHYGLPFTGQLIEWRLAERSVNAGVGSGGQRESEVAASGELKC